YAGLIDERTARPKATHAQDMFYDRSRNPYIDRHPPLAGRGWGGPQLWTPIPGTALRGRDRPQPPAPWPGEGGADVVQPAPYRGPGAPDAHIRGLPPGGPGPDRQGAGGPAADRLLRPPVPPVRAPPLTARVVTGLSAADGGNDRHLVGHRQHP